MDAETLKSRLDAEGYIYDETLVTTLLVALKLGRPLLIEGAAGVGKTEIAKVMSFRKLVRKKIVQTVTEIPSAIGSARKTANTLSVKKCGRI